MRYRFFMLATTCLLIGLGLAATRATEPEAQDAEAKPSVEFDGQTFYLAYDGEDDDASIREFLPQGQQLDSWTQIASIRTFEKIDDPSAFAIASLQQLKRDYPQSPSYLYDNPGAGIVTLDFVVWPADESFVEFNVFRYEKQDNGGIVAQQYALRAYGDDTEPFLKELGDHRSRIVALMATDGLQSHDSDADESANTQETTPTAVP